MGFRFGGDGFRGFHSFGRGCGPGGGDRGGLLPELGKGVIICARFGGFPVVGEKLIDGIEKYRKANATITVTNKYGTPVKNAEIIVNQIKHEFKYGANLFMLDELETEERTSFTKNT